MKKAAKKAVFGFTFMIATVAIGYILKNYLDFELFKSNRLWLKLLVDKNYGIVVLGYIAFYIVSVLLSFPIAAILTLAGGFLFGTFLGAFYANSGATLGAVGAFLLVRYLLGNWIQDKYKKQLQRFNNEFNEYGIYYLLIIRLVAVFPFFLVNMFAGLTRVSVWHFMWTTAIGIVPAQLIFTYAGDQLTIIDKPSDLFSARVVSAFLFLALLAFLPVLFRKCIKKKKR